MADVTIADVRAKYPQYSDLSDDQLAGALHKKFYADMPEDQFRQKIGLGKTATQQPAKPEPSLGEKALSVVEGAGHILSGAAGALGGGLNYAATLAATRDPKAAEAVKQSTEEALTYQPRTQYGQEGVANIERPFQKLAAKADTAGDATLRATGSPLLASGVRTAIEGAPNFIPLAPKALRAAGRAAAPLADAVAPTVQRVAGRIADAGEARAAVRAAEEAPKNQKIEQAKALGIRLAPSEAGGPTGKILEGVGGKVQTEQALSRANAKVLNREAAKEIGLSDRQPMTEANIERLKQKQFAVYDRVKKAGRIAADDDFRQELEKVKDRTQQASADYPEDTNELIDKEINKFNRKSADAGSMLEKIKSLRGRASRNMKSPDAEKFELGVAQKKIATAMENLIERQVSDKSLVSDFRNARTNLAKIYNVEDALGPNGNISAAVLARQLDRGVPLSGNLRQIAEVYKEFPKVLRSVDGLGGHAPFSALDYLVGGVEAAANPASAARVVGALAGRPLARGVITSKAYQRAAIKPRTPKPSVAARAARRIADQQTLESLHSVATPAADHLNTLSSGASAPVPGQGQ